MMLFHVNYILTIIATTLPVSSAWKQWEYISFTTDDWRDVWGYADGPRGRFGHSLVLWNETRLVLFGGRDNDVHRPHIPKTYELIEEDGIFSFKTYTDKPLVPDYDPTCIPETTCVNLTNATSGNTESCSYSWEHVLDGVESSSDRLKKEESCGFTISALIYNDVWVYDLECERYGDEPCVNDGWNVLHPGIRYGGCREEGEQRVCDAPSERWGHGAAMIDSDTMVVYGGYSQECEDYCSDVWIFDFKRFAWKRIFYSSPPGKRWKYGMVSGGGRTGDSIKTIGQVYIFGGHRLWHGFSEDNSQENRWNRTEIYPEGGYLKDLWVLEKKEMYGGEDGATVDVEWSWNQELPQQVCFPDPGLSWDERNNVRCEVFWPKGRSGHAMAFDKERNRIWIHGGYRTHFPYPSTNSPGSGPGVKSRREKGFVPYTTQSYYLDDLWYYDVSKKVWKEVIPNDTVRPTARTDHFMVLSRNMLLLYGGFSDNQLFNDTWYFNINENRWLEKISFVHASFPEECQDDIVQIEQDDDCIELQYPLPLQRAANNNDSYQQVLPYSKQPGYVPDPEHPFYFGIVENAEEFVASLKGKQQLEYERGDQTWSLKDAEMKEGTPIAPNAATGPRQYARNVRIKYNETLHLDIWEWCISVAGEPTRGKVVDGKFGRSNETVHIRQPRRQTVGWDGCRELEWVVPTSRSMHRGILVEKHNMVMIYGGRSYQDRNHHSTGRNPLTGHFNNITFNTIVVDDMWTFGIDNCPRNCSNSGICKDGFCECDPGFYGLDCSNVTCPGTVCYYDENHVQHCEHCCYDGYSHSHDEDESYVTGVAKVPCRPLEGGGDFTGSSNGICDGFGTCQCAPPFLGDDCSIRDCKDNCNGNGYCSVEFPISRCICNDGYAGDSCQFIECLNNCSYPNGECNRDSGTCVCNPIFSPYNLSQIFTYWQGEDCSFLVPFANGSKYMLSFQVLMLVFILSILLLS